MNNINENNVLLDDKMKDTDFEITELEAIDTPSTVGNIVLVGGIYVGAIYGICAC